MLMQVALVSVLLNLNSYFLPGNSLRYAFDIKYIVIVQQLSPFFFAFF